MKLGDLVELSAYGNKRKFNACIKHEKFGLVIQKGNHYLDWWRIRWYPSNRVVSHSRIEVRHVKLREKS